MANPQQYLRSTSGLPKYILPALLLIPAILAVVVIRYYPPRIIDIFVYGGWDLFLYNICVALLIPYFIIFILALGHLYLSRLPNGTPFPFTGADLWLFSFFAGCGVLTVFGFTLGLLHLLYFWVCFPIFVLVIYFFFLHPNSGRVAVDLWHWISPERSEPILRYSLIALRVTLMAVIAAILLSKGILLELFKDGGLHQYFSYFADTSMYHSTWMDPGHPVLFDYLAGRGEGVYLFFTSFTNQFTIHIVGAIYLILIAVVARQVIHLVLSVFTEGNKNSFLSLYLPDLVMLLVLTSPILDMEPARFHLQTGAFFLFLCWSASLFLVLEKKKTYWLFLAQIPILIAFPITSGIFYAFIGWILGVVIIALLMTRNAGLLKYPFLQLVIGGVSALLSFSLNWLYVGIPELQPSRIFIPFIVMERFQKWSSPSLLFYLDSSMGNSVSQSRISIQEISSNALRLFSYPSDILAKHGQYPGFLLSLYPIVVIGILIWIGSRYFRGGGIGDESAQRKAKFFIYWLTFTAFYILRFVLTTFVQQSSLDRMLLFMDIFPILTFFSMLIFLIHRLGVDLDKRV